MKKSLIALAALATVATAAQAQSSVTLYGIIDAGVGRVTTAGTTNTQAISGGLSSSRWGVRGTEDLGGGLSAGFNLESEIAVDTGVAGSTGVTAGSNVTPLFNRASNVSLTQSGVGTLTLGRKNRLEYDLVVGLDPFGGANIGSFTRVGYISGGVIPTGDARVSDSVTLQSAAINGVTAAVQQSFGEQAGTTSGLKQVAYAVNYSAGKLFVGGSYAKNHNADGSENHNNTVYGATYDFGVAKAFVAHAEREAKATGIKTKVDMVGVVVPVNANVNLIGNYISMKNTSTTLPSGATLHTGTTGANADAFGVGATYAFSKRTTAYVLYGNVDNEGNAKVYTSSLFTAPGANTNTTSYAVGVRHAF